MFIFTSAFCREAGTIASLPRYARANLLTLRERTMGRGLLLWLIGIPLPIILIIWLLGGLH